MCSRLEKADEQKQWIRCIATISQQSIFLGKPDTAKTDDFFHIDKGGGRKLTSTGLLTLSFAPFARSGPGGTLGVTEKKKENKKRDRKSVKYPQKKAQKSTCCPKIGYIILTHSLWPLMAEGMLG